MNSKLSAGWAGVLLSLALALPVYGQAEKSVIIVVNMAGSTWPDGKFADRLNAVIAEHNGIEVADQDAARQLMDLSQGRFDKQQAIDHGLASEHRFVFWCDVKREDMKIEKGFSFPFLAGQRHVIAQMEVEYRIVDCYRGRLVTSEKLKVKKQGPSSLQLLDFSDADPNLYVSYFDRKELFDKLEQEAADKLTDAFADLARQR